MKYKAYKKQFEEKYENHIINEYFMNKFITILMRVTHLGIQERRWVFTEKIDEMDEGALRYSLTLIKCPEGNANEFREHSIKRHTTYNDLLGHIIFSVHFKIISLKRFIFTTPALNMEIRASDSLFSLFSDDKEKIEAWVDQFVNILKRETGMGVISEVKFSKDFD